MPPAAFAPRSLLFVPGGCADMIAKLARIRPDAVAIDLEDAVAPADKDGARRSAVAAITALGPVAGTTLLMRVNPPGTPWFADDMAALAGVAAGAGSGGVAGSGGGAGVAGVVVPKVDRPAHLEEIHSALAGRGVAGALVIVGIETALGVADCRSLLTDGVTGAYFGAEDFVADMGGRRTVGGDEALYARSQVCLAARLAGVAAIDQVVVDVRDDDRYRTDAIAGRALGFVGKICLHPQQVAVAHEVFTPSAAEVDHAHRVVEAGRSGVGVVDGAMVDDVHVRMAGAVLRRAGDLRGGVADQAGRG